MMVVGGSASRSLSKELADELGCGNAEVECRRFPDAEAYVRVKDDLDGEHVVLVQTTYPDGNLVELLLLQDAVRDFDIAGLTTVVPYFAYARQDKKFNPGEPISARNMARHIGLLSDEVIVVDIHETSILDWFGKPARNVTAMPQLALKLQDMGVDTVVGPDKGAVELAMTAGETIHCPWDHLEKTRIDGETVQIKPKNLAVRGKRVAIVDDIIATGGTIIEASLQLKKQGALSVSAACTHGLYTNNALERLGPELDGVISTDTIENETSVVSAAMGIARCIGD